MKTVAVANQKGGVGKTTTAVNLAAALAKMGHRVLLADLDSQGNATSAMGVADPDARSLYYALIGEARAQDLVQPTRISHLFTIPADLDLAGSEVEVARMDDHAGQLRLALSDLRANGAFDFAFLDCPPSLGITMMNALVAADEILIPIQCEYYALEGLTNLMAIIGQLRIGANPALSISGMVLTMFDSRNKLNGEVVAEVRKHFEEVVYDTVIPRSIRFGEAPSHGRTIFEHDPRGAGSMAYRALAEEFVRRQKNGISFTPQQPASHE